MLEEISTQNYQLQHDNAEKTYIIDKLTEERDYLASQQSMFAAKMENYQKVIQRTKHVSIVALGVLNFHFGMSVQPERPKIGA